MNESRDDPRDAHLLAALRHAPDRDAVPPREVSERILAAARAAVRPACETRVPWWQRLSAWLMQPQVAASFGTLVVASLVGVMWSTRELPLAESTPSSVVAPPLDAAKPSMSEAADASAATRETRVEIAVVPPPKPAPRRDAAARAEPRARTAAEAPPGADQATTTAPPAAAPSPPAAQQAADAAAPVAPAAAPAAAPAIVAERRSANESDSPLLARQQGAAAARSASATTTAGSLLAAKARADEPLMVIDAALAAGARWQVSGLTGERPHGDAQRAFWASVKAATQGRWEAVQPLSPLAPWLVIEQGSSVAIVWIMNGALYVTAQGQSWRAPVEAARMADWQAQVARW